MAAIVGTDLETYTYYIEAEDVDAKQIYKEWQEYSEKILHERYYERYINKLPRELCPECGFARPPAFLARVGRLTKGKAIYDYNNYTNVGDTVVSARFKAAHDKIAPGSNQFVPIKILNKDGSDYGGEYYIFGITTALDAINPSLGGFTTEELLGQVTYSIASAFDVPNVSQRLAVYKDRVQGHAMWHDIRFGYMYPFVSDAFWNELEAIKVTGLKVDYNFHEL